ncbi:MAG: tyrosine-type recombinase/integrase [bacterium]
MLTFQEKKDSNLPFYNEFFLELISNNYSDKTVANYQRDLEAFEAFLKDEEKIFKEINKLDISRYKDYLRSGKYLLAIKKLRKITLTSENARDTSDSRKSSPSASRKHSMYNGRLSSYSTNRMLSALRTYFKFLNEIDFKLPIIPDSIKLVKTEKKLGHVAELEELTSLIEAPNVYETKPLVILRNRAMLEVLFATGMRISELINLNREDLKLDSTGQSITDHKIYIIGKGKKERFVYLTERAKQHLQSYLATRSDAYPALFIPYRGLRSGSHDPYIVRIATNYLQAKIKQYRLLLGINLPTSAHSLRHGFATYLAEKGANPVAIQKLLGHESLTTTSKYVHASDKYAEKSHQKYHPLGD